MDPGGVCPRQHRDDNGLDVSKAEEKSEPLSVVHTWISLVTANGFWHGR
jgi:hypothetical protein